jgi:hypothetical protein
MFAERRKVSCLLEGGVAKKHKGAKRRRDSLRRRSHEKQSLAASARAGPWWFFVVGTRDTYDARVGVGIVFKF